MSVSAAKPTLPELGKEYPIGDLIASEIYDLPKGCVVRVTGESSIGQFKKQDDCMYLIVDKVRTYLQNGHFNYNQIKGLNLETAGQKAFLPLRKEDVRVLITDIGDILEKPDPERDQGCQEPMKLSTTISVLAENHFEFIERATWLGRPLRESFPPPSFEERLAICKPGSRHRMREHELDGSLIDERS